jgi:hypothetical protein
VLFAGTFCSSSNRGSTSVGAPPKFGALPVSGRGLGRSEVDKEAKEPIRQKLYRIGSWLAGLVLRVLFARWLDRWFDQQ